MTHYSSQYIYTCAFGIRQFYDSHFSRISLVFWNTIILRLVFLPYFSRILECDNFMTRISLVFWWVLGPAIPKLWVFGARWDPGTPDSNGVGVQWDCRMHIFLVLWNTTILLLLTWFESNWAPNPTLYLCPWCTSIFLVFWYTTILRFVFLPYFGIRHFYYSYFVIRQFYDTYYSCISLVFWNTKLLVVIGFSLWGPIINL